MKNHVKNVRLGRQLVLDELFDLTLYRKLRKRCTVGPHADVLDQLIPIEERHTEFWQKFFSLESLDRLDARRRMKLVLLSGFCRMFGSSGIHLVLESIEVYGIRKYLTVWELYKNDPLGKAVRGVLEDEFEHEDAILEDVGGARVLSADRIRNIFLGLNDGLVEILGAVSGFFAAFSSSSAIIVASLTVSIAGAISMAAGAYVALDSEREVAHTDHRRRVFLGKGDGDSGVAHPIAAAVLVGISYVLGAMVPVLPVLLGARTLIVSVCAAAIVMALVSSLLAFLTGMRVARRMLTNVVILGIAVGVTYAIGIAVRSIWGIAL
ncbi:MAG: VIT1/CCC1 transporter family protein [Candidatus Uhrbacteria bacterium]